MQVILKATTACNASCRYCSAVPDVEGGYRLRAEELAPLFEAFRSWLADDDARRLSFVWHGGEPTLPGLDLFRRAAEEHARVFGSDGERITHRLQSNLLLIDDAWVAFLKTFVKSIGTSFDLVDDVRTVKDGRPLAARWVRAVNACLEAGIPVGVVYVVHRGSLGRARDLYHYFRNLLGGARLRINPVYPEGRAATDAAGDLAITPEEYGAFLVEIAKLWWDDGRRSSVLPLKEWHDAWHGDVSRLACDSGGTCQERILGIGPDGSAWGCGRFADHGEDAWRLGNVFHDDLDAILGHPMRTRLTARTQVLQGDGCGSCPWFRVCHGGCPMMAKLVHGDAMSKTPFCEGRRKVFRFLEERLGPVGGTP